ncbi:hypothetical protein OGAPHI_002071 [Ogataea philodendri]|uniref:Uncharacterized protein n=1 Tax=Ogataea philodendri TaxID=1378263 RepID=A0A9P8PAJ1_9ASCO|nr:uncharacterized protein OGAPHI_002071 [Ogataea philodendri]KAH3668317.1 hypothetical protein OGAPHI_002071 [Ogataea philodendri]
MATIALSWASASLALALVIVGYSHSVPLILITALEYTAGLFQLASLCTSNWLVCGSCLLVNLASMPVVVYWIETLLDAPSKCKYLELSLLTTYIVSCLFRLGVGRRISKIEDPEANTVKYRTSAQTLVDENANKSVDLLCQKSMDLLQPNTEPQLRHDQESVRSEKASFHNTSSDSFEFQYKSDAPNEHQSMILPQLEDPLVPVSYSSAELENITEIPLPQWSSPAYPGMNHISLESWNNNSAKWQEQQQLWGNNFFKRPDMTRSFSNPISIVSENQLQATTSRSRSSTVTRYSRMSPSASSSPLKRLRSLKFKRQIKHSQSQPELNFDFLKTLQTSPIRTHQHQKTLSSNFKTPYSSPVKSVAGISLHNLNEDRTPDSQLSNPSSKSSVPSVVIGAYDREKWHTIKSQLLQEALESN